MLLNGRITYSHDVIFDENIFPSPPSELGIIPSSMADKDYFLKNTSSNSNNHPPSVVNEEAIAQQSSLLAPSRLGWDILLKSNTEPKNVFSNLDEANILEGKRRRAKMTIISHVSKNPKSWDDAMQQPNKKKWVNALNKKLHNLTSRGVIETVPLPLGKRAIVKDKVRICAQGFSQQPGVDYDNTFSPTGKFSSFRALLYVARNRNLEVHHMDAVAAFLNPSLNEEIYMKIPTFIKRLNKNEVWKLHQPLYGLKQSSRYWYLDISDFFGSIGLNPSNADPGLFISTLRDWQCFVHIHVDDLTVASNDISRFKVLISKRFEMEDLGRAISLLGMKVTKRDNCYFLSQSSYISDLLDSHDMKNCKPVSTHMVPNLRLQEVTDNERKEFEVLNINYRQAVGKISYLQVATRGDLAFVTSQLSQYLEKPGIKHWLAFKHLLQYLQGMKQLALWLGRNSLSFSIFCDVDFANCEDTRKLVSGFMKKVGDSCITWKSRKQSTISTSSCKA
ncbi:hypothetical protein O181_074552 [Austropuccinia psidii MF-1]|uniref:Reverse transcriptase Ty1/copia-type domain-containing protein n=1 Tax=Austropuccinia psidii MF-1 TaxID=1389203 RepID=A0A9Q3IC25_9BASI|nr:hypothetical protein [Austropuccinia psidii MF-1]